MHYEEIRPAPPLTRYIKCFWHMESASAGSAGPERVLPDGCTEIVFNLADPFNQQHDDGTIERQPLTLLVGQMRRHVLIEPTGRVSLLGVRFWPGGAYPFLTLPQDELAEKIIALDAVWGGMARELQCRIGEAPTSADRVKQVEAVLLARLNRFRERDEAILKAVPLILRTYGCVSIETLAEQTGISSRQMDRRFNARVGLPPKALCRIVRFQRVFTILERNGNGPNWVRVALDCGYYDQSHFIKEFKAFAGKEPTSYFSEPNVMSDHFTQNS